MSSLRFFHGAAIMAAFFTQMPAHASVSLSEAQKLKSTLTPFGAEKAGNTAGTIPAWSGGVHKPVNGNTGGRNEPDPYAGEKPLFSITAQNMNQYAANLAEGEKALFKIYPQTFKMNIYTTHRSESAPQWVYDNTFKCATSASVKDWGIEGCIGGIPFPILSGSNEEQAMQAIWNHILRFRGQYVVRRSTEAVVQRSGAYSPITIQQELDFRYYNPAYRNLPQLNNIIFNYLSFTVAPARMAGEAILVHETLDQRKDERQGWGYNAGQRRVRQAPRLAYDTPVPAADGLRTADDTDMYNGAPDKYDWKLIGKKEIYIPYNNYEVDSPKLTYKAILTPNHPNPDYLRYELHRVWVVEGNLKKEERHIYAKRRFYIDEDSWSVAVADQYDSRGDLWRVSMAFLKNYYDVPTTWSAIDVYHDLQARRYHIQNLVNEEGVSLDFSRPSPGDEYFSPAELRRRGTR